MIKKPIILQMDNMESQIIHKPVMIKEVLSFIPENSNIVVDATLGEGGHTKAMLDLNLEVHSFERDIKRLSELSNGEVNIIHLMGGEPLLNPNIKRFFEIARKYFDKTEIKLITNGILLLKQDNSFWQSMKDNKITLAPTKYPIKIDWDKIKEICKDMNIKLNFFNGEDIVKTSFYSPLNLEGTENPEWNFRNCFLANNCLILENGRLYTCSYIPNIRHFNKFFNKNIPISVNDYIDIHKARNYQEILQFLAKPIPFCKYCDVKNNEGRNSFENFKKRYWGVFE